MTVAPPTFAPAVDAPVCVGLSGGLDSTALLHALASDPRQRERGLRALHVHHGLQPDADAWATHCIAECARLDIRIDVVHVDVTNSTLGREGAARDARYAAFANSLRDGEHLALAHHRDDQAETFLLRALRASSIDGLAAMAPLRALARGVVWRPWLGAARADLRAYAIANGLRWIDDPSNADHGFDRNFLRLRVMPLLRERWPSVDDAFATAARLAAETSDLLDDEDAAALARCTIENDADLSRSALLALDPARRARVLRRWIVSHELPPLPANGIERITDELLEARPDAQARFDWHGATVRAWRDRLHASRVTAPIDATFDVAWDGMKPLALPDGGELVLAPALPLPTGTRVRARQGGERIRLPGRDHRHELKDVLLAAGIPPWIREHLPLLVAGDEVLAAGDLVVSATLAALLETHGARIIWTPPA
ncbi:tRNA lysidine(34) synthetase TilS [Lysobacter sp. HA18]